MIRSKHSLSHYKLLSGDMGELIPIGLIEVLPGDTVQQATSVLLRLAPLLSPVMHPVHVRVHHWFVPHRLCWTSWEDFITGGPDGLNASVFPTITIAGGAAVGSLADYLGVPTGVAGIAVSALPFRAYGLIWNEHYRDQDLETKVVVATGDGADATTNTLLKNVAWEKDYFTSSRPWEQKGPVVTVPLGTTAPVLGIGIPSADNTPGLGTANYKTAAGTTVSYDTPFAFSGTDTPGMQWKDIAGTKYPDLRADLSAASAVTVNVLREALAMQRFEEARARYGSRYVEYLRYLGVRSSDGRLNRPEYLGGGRQTVQFSEVLAHAETGATVKVGDMKGHGIAAMRSRRYRRFIEEHGYIMSLLSVKPKTMYAQGLHRTWNRRFKDDFWQRELETIGQQGIENREIYAAHATPLGTFGYQDRYDEYRRMESGIAGEFRNTTLDFWHMARLFGSTPALNATFVSSVPTKRNFAVSTNDIMYCMAMHSIQARRLVRASGGKSFIA